MKLTPYGAAGEVTGSCHLLQVGQHRILLDCGLIQGQREDELRNRDPFPFDVRSLDAVILSHAHIDHSGRLPMLVRAGYRGPIYTQHASRSLCAIMLKDAGYIQEKDAEWENHKRERKGLPPVEPLYTREDSELVMPQVQGCNYNEEIDVLPGVRLRFRDAGHILGASIVELWLTETGRELKLVFSGDLGHHGRPVLRDPSVIDTADVVLMESTYGDRLHRSLKHTYDEMAEVIARASRSRGNILVPAFAVGRTQALLYLFSRYETEWGLENWQIVLDSPLAIEATEIYFQHPELCREEAAPFWRKNHSLDLSRNILFSRSSEDSMRLNRIRSGALIIAGSGMCTGGRIRHHLKHNVWREDCHVIIVGYQGVGTLGRRLVDGARNIRLWGETIRVAATVHTIGGLSAHADQRNLVNWYQGFRNRPPVYLVHGEPEAQQALADVIEQETGVRPGIPARGETIEL